jgi:transposase
MTRKAMRFVPIKTAEQQADAMVLMVVRLWSDKRTPVDNALRSHLTELGIIDGAGRGRLMHWSPSYAMPKNRLPAAARLALTAVADLIEALAGLIGKIERDIVAAARADEDMRRLTTVPGIGAIMAATIKALGRTRRLQIRASPRCWRGLAWTGLTPRQHSEGRSGWGVSRIWDIPNIGASWFSQGHQSCGSSGKMSGRVHG